ncbi:hypothetical protein INR75_02050 [Zunongwangia sp. SCSIO 43204]|uniref:hypothetical protein n=1 Tax=Zunongwangia sp. SCSIO 43204 TaxID=2779359 RepID=UPI001CA9CB83|nr:hypothetical protein [Zunongwangia sp. SCSIO 43204]UAB84834.1 hypothetical protein INR75_02050 [Zunongwangia sp. SCSIO 43204]
MAITVLISLYTTRLVLDALGVSDYGIYNVVGGAISMLGFLHAAMSSATQRFMSFYEGKGDLEKQKVIFNVSTVLHYCIALFLVIILIFAGYFFFKGILNIPNERVFAAKVVYGSLIVSTLFTVVSVPYEAVLNANENMLYYSIVGIVESLLKLGIAAYILHYSGDKLVIYGVLMAMVPLISRVIMQIYCHRRYDECVISIFKYWDRNIMKDMTSFAGWNFFGTSVSMVTNYGQGIVINHFFGTRVNAAQGISNQISGQIDVFSLNMLKALNPIIVKREGKGDRSAMLNSAIIGSKFSFFLLAIFALPIILEMPFILKLWLKNVPDYAVIFCRLLLVRAIITRTTSGLSTAIAAAGNIKVYQITISLMAILPILISCGFFYLGYEPWILYLVYIVHVIVRSWGVMVYFTRKLCGLDIRKFYLQVILPSICIVFLSILVSLWPFTEMEMGYLRLLSVISLSMLSFSSLFFFVCLDRKERNIIYGAIRNIKEVIKNRYNK